MCVCVCAGELFKEMTVDYESTASEERLDEVGPPVTLAPGLSTTSAMSTFKGFTESQIQRQLLNFLYFILLNKRCGQIEAAQHNS